MSEKMERQKKFEKTVVDGYQKIEDAVVEGYQKIEDAFVGGYQKIEDKFVNSFMTQSNSSPEDDDKIDKNTPLDNKGE